MYQDLHFYVDFDWGLYAEDSKNYLPEIYRIVELAYQHKATVLYSGQQIQEFIQNCDDLDDNFLESHGNKLSVVLQNAVKQSNHRYFFEICFSEENTSLHHVSDPAISIIGTYSKNALISISKHQYQPLLAIKSVEEFEVVSFKVLNEPNDLLKWVQENSNSRTFNLSPKHGENGRGQWNGESPLLCSALDAQFLLNTAIPDFNEKDKRLFNFDENHQTFIEFFYEGDNPQNQWHGFHVNSNDWGKRIPSRIKKYFDK